MKYILSGGPNSGKSTIINQLLKQGFRIIPEAAQIVINKEKQSGGNIFPWTNRDLFQRKVMETQLELEKEIQDNDIVFMDRSIIDGIAYYHYDNIPIPRKLINICQNYFLDKIFILDSLPLDPNHYELNETYEESLKIKTHLINAYKRFGFKPIIIPVNTVSRRIELILKYIEHQ